MGVYIKDMEMPKHCDECRCICSRWNGNEMLWRCGLSVDPNYIFVDRRDLYDECPLTEVPEPHGRLIDADALADDLEADGKEFGDEMKLNCASWLRSNATPTVIERSK